MSSSPSLLCQDEVAEHVVNHQPGARVSSDFATFPSTTFVKVSAATDTVTAHHLFIFLRVHRGRGVTQDSGDSPHSTLAQLI